MRHASQRVVVAVLLSIALAGCASTDDVVNAVKATGIPVITQLVPDNGKPGDTIAVRGANFGTTAGTVGFQDANGNNDQAAITSWQDDTIVLKVPQIPGNPDSAPVHLITSGGMAAQLPPSFTLNH